MNEKRFKLKISSFSDDHMKFMNVEDNGKRIKLEEIVDLLNEQQATIQSLKEELELTANTKLYSRRKLEEDNEQLKKQLSACKEGQQNLMKGHRNDEEALDKIWNIIKELYGSDGCMSDERFKVDYEVGVLDTKTNEIICDTLNAEEVVALLNEQQDTIRKLQDLCGESDGENAKLRIENKQLRKQQQRLYNYFRDYLEDEMSAENFGEMWDTVKEDERWNE